MLQRVGQFRQRCQTSNLLLTFLTLPTQIPTLFFFSFNFFSTKSASLSLYVCVLASRLAQLRECKRAGMLSVCVCAGTRHGQRQGGDGWITGVLNKID